MPRGAGHDGVWLLSRKEGRPGPTDVHTTEVVEPAFPASPSGRTPSPPSAPVVYLSVWIPDYSLHVLCLFNAEMHLFRAAGLFVPWRKDFCAGVSRCLRESSLSKHEALLCSVRTLWQTLAKRRLLVQYCALGGDSACDARSLVGRFRCAPAPLLEAVVSPSALKLSSNSASSDVSNCLL